MSNRSGNFIVSLDFELLWGLRDIQTKESSKDMITMARKVIPELLVLFKKYEIHTTWAIVGLLFAESKEEMLKYSPEHKPNYKNSRLSAYNYFDDVGENESQDIFHFANSLINMIQSQPNQEIGSHTFSHYNCWAEGQTVDEFKEDLSAALEISKDKFGIQPESLVLPRNQYVQEYINEAYKLGFKTVRGNPKKGFESDNLFQRVIRLVDAYTNILGKKCYTDNELKTDTILNLRASCFFRPYSKMLCFLEPFKIMCIKSQMKHAAKSKKVFHLWWHPHNFGKYPKKCLNQIEDIFKYYKHLKDKYGFTSVNMKEMGEIINESSFIVR